MVTLQLSKEVYITLGIFMVIGFLTLIGVFSFLMFSLIRLIIKKLDLKSVSNNSPKNCNSKNNEVKPPKKVGNTTI